MCLALVNWELDEPVVALVLLEVASTWATWAYVVVP